MRPAGPAGVGIRGAVQPVGRSVIKWKIASEAGYTHGALYGYFSSKEELFYAITDPVAEQLMEMLDKIQKKMQNIPKEKRLHEMGSIYYENIPKIVDIDRDRKSVV